MVIIVIILTLMSAPDSCECSYDFEIMVSTSVIRRLPFFDFCHQPLPVCHR